MQTALKTLHTGKKLHREQEEQELAGFVILPESSMRDRLPKGLYYYTQLDRNSTFLKKNENKLVHHVIMLLKHFFRLHRIN